MKAIQKLVDIVKNPNVAGGLTTLGTGYFALNDFFLDASRYGAQYMKDPVDIAMHFGGPLIVGSLVRTVLKRTSERNQLINAQKRLRRLTELADVSMWEMDKTGRLTWVNDQCYKDFGYTPQDFERGINALDLIVEKETAINRLAQLEKDRRIEPYEYTCIRKDESTWPGLFQSSLIRNKKGDILGFSGLILNITERKQLEQEIIHSERLYKSLFENTGVATVIFDDDSIIKKCNHEFANLAGYARSDIEGILHWYDFVHPEDLEMITGFHKKRSEEQRAPREYQFRFVDATGDIRHISNTIVVVPGKEKLRISSLKDVTDMKNTEKALRISEEKYKTLVEHLPGYVCVFDPNLNIRWANKNYADSYGFSTESIIGKTFIDWIVEPDRQKVIDNIGALSIERPVQSHEQRVIIDGKEKTELWINKAFFDINGDPMFYHSFGQDITELKRLQKALGERRNRTLEAMENSTDHIYLVDKEGVYIHVNETYADRIGMNVEHIIGKTYAELHPEETFGIDQEMFYKNLEVVTETKEAVSYDLESGKDGTMYLRTLSPVLSEEGEVVEVLVTSKDISSFVNDSEMEKILLPICSSCKDIRREGVWEQNEKVMSELFPVDYSHGICQDCAKKLYPDMDLSGIFKET